MTESDLEAVEDFRSELRLSPLPAIILLFMTAIVTFVVAGIPAALEERFRVMILAVVMGLLSTAALYVYRWHVWAGRWFSVLVITSIVHTSAFWLGASSTLLLNVLPVALAGALISVPASAATAVIQTIILFNLPGLGYETIDPSVLSSAVIAIWAMVAVMYGVYYPVRRVANWAWEYFQKAQHLL